MELTASDVFFDIDSHLPHLLVAMLEPCPVVLGRPFQCREGDDARFMILAFSARPIQVERLAIPVRSRFRSR
jgi:hypothetical protein